MSRLIEGVVSRVRDRVNAVREREGDDQAARRKTYWRCYTIAFLIALAGTLLVYFVNLRSFMWGVDGLEQYYPYFVYEGQLIREVVGGLLAGQGLQIPLWSFQLGFGTDIPSTLDVFFDPLNLLSGLCPEQYSEYLFQLLIVVRFYLAGVTFSMLALRFSPSRFAVLAGALLYVFCGTSFEAFLWPGSMWPMILFPLLLLGVEKIIAGERPFTFIAAAMLFFLTSYYFSYMACLLLIPYCAARVIVTGVGRSPARFIMWTLKLLGFLLVGICIAGVALVPTVMALLGLDRVSDTSVSVPLFYSLDQVLATVAGFVGTANIGSDCYMGFGAAAVLACALMFVRKRTDRLLKAAFIAGSLMLVLPIAGSIMNGFNYATNRWVWAYALLVCFIVVRYLPDLMDLDGGERRRLFIIACAVSALIVLIPVTRNEHNGYALCIMFALMVALFWKDLSYIAHRLAVGICVVVSIWVSAIYFIAPEEGGWAKAAPPFSFMYDYLTDFSPNWQVAGIDDNGLWRYDADMASSQERKRNDSAVLGLMGVDFYNSAYNDHIDRYFTEMGVCESEINFSYKHFGDRPILDTLAGVKYMIVKDGCTPPYNYDDPERVVAGGPSFDISTQVFEGENVLPLAYTYGSTIPREAYESFTPAQKQEALLQGIVLEEGADSRDSNASGAGPVLSASLPTTELSFDQREVPFEVTSSSGIDFEDGRIIARNGGAWMTLSFDGLDASETYVAFDNLNYRALSPIDLMGEQFDALPWYKQVWQRIKTSSWTEPNVYFIHFESDTGYQGRFIQNWNSSFHLYGGKSDWLVNLGYAQDGQTFATISFTQPGLYTFDDLEVVCQPMGSFDQRVDALKSDVVDDLRFGVNEIAGSVDLDESKAVFFSVAYSDGWKAFVDGAEVPVYRANTGFMALELGAGAHDIKLRYWTPGLTLGIVMSIAGLAAVGMLAAYYRLRARRRADGER